ncbi:MAG: D-amino-acid transaminase [Hyphomicrobiales bacterium]|nr:D-amino-acid transaminase [Hyphomicrobiales bacterium]
MSRTVYVNGEFLPEENAKISVFDRGFLFADAAYEVFPVLGGGIADADAHLARLARSLDELNFPTFYTPDEYLPLLKTLVRNNKLEEGLVYIQVSRGIQDRDFNFPKNTDPSVVMFTQQKSVAENPVAKTGISVITVPDIRWQRCDIKTVGLLPACLAKAEAARQGADDAWMHDEDNNITEGSSNNAHIITQDGKLVTRQLSNAILHGITRVSVLKLLEQTNLILEERPFSIAEAEAAKEAFCSSASAFVMPVVKINGVEIADGKPGPHAVKLRELCIGAAIESAAKAQATRPKRSVKVKSA